MQSDLPMEEVIKQFRHMLPAGTATAQAIDQHEPWESIAMKAVDDGYIDTTREFGWFVEICVRPGGR